MAVNDKNKFTKFKEEEIHDEFSKPNISLNSNENVNVKESELGEQKELNEKHIINKLIDDMGFSRYHFLVFSLTALILISGGVQELMLAIVLSMINSKENLNTYHLAMITTSEYIGYAMANLFVNFLPYCMTNKTAIQVFTIMCLIFTGLSIFLHNFYIAYTNRFFIGVCLGILDILLYLNLIEICPTRIRGFIGSFILLFFPLGQFIIAIICYVQLVIFKERPDIYFKILLLIPYTILAILVLSLLPFILNSVRELAATNQVKESVEMVEKISKFNKNESFLAQKEGIIKQLIRQNSDKNMERKKTKTAELESKVKIKKSKTSFIGNPNLSIESIMDHNSHINEENKHDGIRHISTISTFDKIQMLFSKKFLKYTVILSMMAAMTGFIFNGIFFMLPTTAPKLNHQTFIEVIISVSLELPSNFLVALAIEAKVFGRLKIIRFGYFITILVCISCLAIGKVYLIIECLLKFFITIPNNVIIVYTSEIYDGEIRTLGLSFITFWKRFAIILSPFVVTYFEYQIGLIGPFYIFLVFTVFSFSLSLLIDYETRGVALDEMEIIKKPI